MILIGYIIVHMAAG